MLPRTPRAHLSRSADYRRWRERDVLHAEVVATAGPCGEHWVRLPGSSVPVFVGSTVGRLAFRPGATVPLLSQSGDPGLVIAGFPAPNRKGSAEFPRVEPSPDVVDVWGIIRASPLVLAVGVDDQAVTVYGYNFAAGDTFRPVVWGGTSWVDDPGATVHDVVIVGAEEATMEIDVEAGRPLGGWVTLEPRRGWEG